MIAQGLYKLAITLATPFINRYLAKRLANGKEDQTRFVERKGQASLPRPDGPLIWIHAASNGEAMSSLPLIDRVLARDPGCHVLLTTGTVTSALLMKQRLPDRAFHQYVPVDRPAWVRRFLDHWQPDLGIWIESEFWPALIWGLRARGRPMALVNGRISSRSLRQWRRFPGLAADLLSGFNPCLAQTLEDAKHLKEFGVLSADCVGNLKSSGQPLPVDEVALDQMMAAIGTRPCWVAASTHHGEEDIILAAHRRLRQSIPSLLTCIVPRHPVRGTAIAQAMAAQEIAVARRSLGEGLSSETEIYLADTIGELGLFYRLAPVALIGGSLCGGHGGHNPIEAAQLNCAILHGLDMANFSAMAEELGRAGGAVHVQDADALAREVERLLNDSAARSDMAKAAASVAEHGAKTVDRIMARLAPVMPDQSRGLGS